MIKRIRFLLDKRRSFSFMDLLRFLGNFVSTFLFFFLELTAQTMVAVRNLHLEIFQWAAIVGFSFLSVVATYFREYMVTKSKQKRIIEGRIISGLLGGLLALYGEYRGKDKKERVGFVKEVLRYTEKAVEAILKESGYPVGDICANIMIVDQERSSLSLEYFGTFKGGREKITLPIDCNHALLPGAPFAYCTEKIHYIEDTLDPKHGGYFQENKPYRSIISIPIRSNPRFEGSQVIAILNIDSDIPDQFVSGDFIAKRIYPQIEPFIMLLVLEQDILSKEGE